MKLNRFLIVASILTPMVMTGQSYYDDDIYYNPSKVKKTEKQDVRLRQTSGTLDFDEPTYQVYTTTPRDVDEYNRRGMYSVTTDTIPSDSVAVSTPDVFQYTERMERFDNPTIIISSDDSRLKELYYTDNVNIYVGTPSLTWSFGSFYDPWYYPYYRSGWSFGLWDWTWGWNAYRPYYGCYDPFWGPSYGYYGWGYSWGAPHHYHPYYAGGVHHNYTDGGRRPFGATHSPSGRRPELSGGNNFRGSDTYRSTGRRPSSTMYTPSSRPSVSRPDVTPTYNGYRGGTTMSRPSQSTPVRRPSISTDNRPSYSTPDRTSTPSHRQPSISAPSRSTGSGGFRGGSSGGGSRGSFSGGSRGGRR